MLFRALMTLLVAGGLTVGATSLTACGGGGEGYKIPHTSPLVPFKKPARSDLVDDEGSTEPVNKQPPPDMGDDDDDDAKATPTPTSPNSGKKAK